MLMALIAIGIAGLIVRAVSSGSDELVLSGLLPISQDVVTRVTVRSSDGESEARLVRIGDVWTINNQQAFPPKLAQFWSLVSDIDGARLIATNEDNHRRMGVAEDQGTVVSFYLDEFIQEQFIVGEWSSDVRLCYLRRPGKTQVHGIECPTPATGIFDSTPDGWRDPVVVAIPQQEVESITFTYPDEEFVLRVSDGEWVVATGDEEQPADLRQLESVLSVLEVVVAKGFADEEEAEGLRFDVADASVRIVTTEGASVPTTRLRFLNRDDISYYLKTPVKATVFIIDKSLADALLKRKADLVSPAR